MAAPTPDQPQHPDHALYQQIREGVAALDARHGRAFDATSERMTASLLPVAKEAGLERVDHVVLGTQGRQAQAGENIFVVQGALDDPAHLRAHANTSQAAQAPVEASFERVQAIDSHAQAQAREPSQQQAQQQAPHALG